MAGRAPSGKMWLKVKKSGEKFGGMGKNTYLCGRARANHSRLQEDGKREIIRYYGHKRAHGLPRGNLGPNAGGGGARAARERN